MWHGSIKDCQLFWSIFVNSDRNLVLTHFCPRPVWPRQLENHSSCALPLDNNHWVLLHLELSTRLSSRASAKCPGADAIHTAVDDRRDALSHGIRTDIFPTLVPKICPSGHHMQWDAQTPEASTLYSAKLFWRGYVHWTTCFRLVLARSAVGYTQVLETQDGSTDKRAERWRSRLFRECPYMVSVELI